MTLGMKMRTMMEIKMMMMTMGFKIRTLMVTVVMLLRMMRMMMVRKSCQQAGNGRMKCERYGGQCFPTSTKASFQHLLAAASAWKKENMNLHRRHFYRHVAEIRSSVWRPGGPGHSVGRSQNSAGGEGGTSCAGFQLAHKSTLFPITISARCRPRTLSHTIWSPLPFRIPTPACRNKLVLSLCVFLFHHSQKPTHTPAAAAALIHHRGTF